MNIKHPLFFCVLILAGFRVSGAATGEKPPSVAVSLPIFNVMENGAIGDGITDDTAALQKTIDRALATNGAIHFPRGIYLVSKPLQVKIGSYSIQRALTMTGDWAILKAAAQMETILDLHVAAHVTVERLFLDGNGLAQHALRAFKLSTRTALVQQVTAHGTLSTGFVLEKCQGAVFRQCVAYKSGGDGWLLTDCNALALADCQAMSNAGNGFVLTSADFSAGANITNIWAEANGKNGIKIQKTTGAITVRGGWIEGNGENGILLDDVRRVSLSDLNIMGVSGEHDHTAIAIRNGTTGCLIRGNFLARSDYSGEFDRIAIDDQSGNIIIRDNLQGSSPRVGRIKDREW